MSSAHPGISTLEDSPNSARGTVAPVSESVSPVLQPVSPAPEFGRPTPLTESRSDTVKLGDSAKFGDSVKFGDSEGFLKALKLRVDAYFVATGLRRRDNPRMYVKTAVILSWAVASYVLLVFLASAWWQVIPLAVSLGVAMAAIGFNIQHDGGHGAYSDRRWVNSLMAMTLDMLGGSSYIWKRTHNIVHHSFTNIAGHDNDIDLGFMGRLSPHQPRYRFHRLQHFYLWFLYGFVTFKWQFVDDQVAVMTGRLGAARNVRPRGMDLLIFVCGKIVFLCLAFVIPMLLHSWLLALAVFFGVSFVQGVVLSVVFQLAHCLEEAEFPLPVGSPARIENEWAVHQVETTVDFARRSRFMTWFTGGLNYQVEHHLFPQICHIHYPAISKLVEETCREYGVTYRVHDSTIEAIVSHYRWLRRLGAAPSVSAAGS